MTQLWTATTVEGETGQRLSAKPQKAPIPYVKVSRFFPDRATIRAQFEWTVAIGRSRGRNVLEEISEGDVYRFYGAGADRVFTKDLVTSFLCHLRRWARLTIGAHHASSPQVEVYSSGCWRKSTQDTIPAQWRYVYAMNANSMPVATRVDLVSSSPDRWLIFFSLRHALPVYLEPGSLLVHETKTAYCIDEVRSIENDPLSCSAFLVGYLW